MVDQAAKPLARPVRVSPNLVPIWFYWTRFLYCFDFYAKNMQCAGIICVCECVSGRDPLSPEVTLARVAPLNNFL